MDTEYEYRLDPANPTRVQVRRKPTLAQAQCFRPSENWRCHMSCDTEAQARRVLALLEGSGEAQVLP